MVGLLVSLLILCLVLGLAYYIVGLLPLPHPFGAIARAVILVIGLIALIYMLLPLIEGHGRRLGNLADAFAYVA